MRSAMSSCGTPPCDESKLSWANLELVVDECHGILVGHDIPNAVASKQEVLVVLLPMSTTTNTNMTFDGDHIRQGRDLLLMVALLWSIFVEIVAKCTRHCKISTNATHLHKSSSILKSYKLTTRSEKKNRKQKSNLPEHGRLLPCLRACGQLCNGGHGPIARESIENLHSLQ
jgi:hypothetical protein